MGVAKAFNLADVSQLLLPISRTTGVLWLLAGLLFITASICYLFQVELWWIVAIPAILLSQGLVFGAWQDAKFGSVANGIALIGVILAIGTWTYYNAYKQQVEAGLKRPSDPISTPLTEADLQPLPEPVRKYLRFSGALGKPKVNHFKVEFTGKIRGSETAAWMPFTSEQFNFMEPATRLFFIKATMKGMPVAGLHAFNDGKAVMDIRLYSMFTVQYQDGAEMDSSETVTFFNDMCCMAPATLIDKRIQWLEVDGNKVKAAFTNHGITIKAWLIFDDQGLLQNFISEDRYATEGKSLKKLPWSTPLKDYKAMNGHQLPGYAETIYTYPNGNFCYGTFEVTQVEYNPSVF